MEYKRIHRLLKILTLIQSEDGWTAKRLMEELGACDRTIRRDLKALRKLDIPYFYDEEKKCYQLPRDFLLKPLNLSFAESLALISLGELVGSDGQVPLTGDAGSAIKKIRSQLPQKFRDKLNKLDGQIAVHLNRTSKGDEDDATREVYDEIHAALTDRQALECRYESLSVMRGDKKAEPFIFKPYVLLFKKRDWYVIGHHGRHNETRNLKLRRFMSFERTEESYDIPESFNLDDHLGNAWSMMRGKSHEVEILFDKEFSETIRSTYWHHTQEFEYQEDDSILFKCTVDGLDEIVWWVMGMGHHAIVKKPLELIDRVREEASKMAALYPPSGSRSPKSN